MLKLIIGKDWVANRNRVLSMIAEDVKQERGGRILMVPELISHDTERRLCAAAGDTASRFAEVLSFTRLAKRVTDQVGGGAVECLDDGGRVVAMAAAAWQLHSRLKAYAAVETKPEFLTELVDAVDEFKRCCITSADLRAASIQTTGSLAQKLEELSLLLENYDSICSRGKRDPRDQMTWLLEQMEDSSFAAEHTFYIDGFPDFTRQHMAILKHLICASPLVTVSLNCDEISSSKMAFEKVGGTAFQILDIARRAGVPVQIIRNPGEETPLAPVCEGLFQGKLPRDWEALRLFREESVYRECMRVGEQILELVRGGCRYRQISIVCADMGVYRNTLDFVMKRCGIPAYLSGTEDILQKSVMVTVLSALEAALGGMEQADVITYLKSALSPLELDICDQVENYAILWGIRGSAWCKPWEKHPDGLQGQWDTYARERLDALNRAREAAIDPLNRLQQAFRSAGRMADQVSAVYSFLEDIRLAERLERLAGQMDDRGDNRSAQILNQLWEILVGALEQMYDVLGQTVWNGECFTRLFILLLGQYKVGTIPPVLDAVTIGPVSAMRCQECRHLFVMGALEGSLPGYGGSQGVLSDQERTTLRELGVPLTGGAMEGLQAEFSEIYGVFCGARETVTLSCPPGQPSFIYRRLEDCAKPVRQPELLGVVLANKEEAGAYLAHRGLESAARTLGVADAYEKLRSRAAYKMGGLERETVHGLYGSRLRLSASQVDRLAECRMAYFLKYGLRARERKEATVDPAEFGTYVHAVLEKTGRRVRENGGFHQVSLEQTLAWAAEYSDAYAHEVFGPLDSKRLEYLFRRNGQELACIVRELWRELQSSKFEPVDFEVGFGDGEKMRPITIHSERIEAVLRGYVDRVDCWKEDGRNYFRVVDYKTGAKTIDYCDIFNGVGLQMLLYLFALEQQGQQVVGSAAIPAGVQYFPARAPFLSADGLLTEEEAEKERRKAWKRSGLLLADDQVITAMEPDGDCTDLCCKRNKNGELVGDLFDRGQLRQLRGYLTLLLGRMTDEIASGNIAPNPYTRGSSHDACAYCPYGSICRQDAQAGRRNYKTMSPEDFWEQIGKELTHNG